MNAETVFDEFTQPYCLSDGVSELRKLTSSSGSQYAEIERLRESEIFIRALKSESNSYSVFKHLHKCEYASAFDELLTTYT
jgi:hypothetical protein